MFEYVDCCENTTRVVFPLPLTIVESMWISRVALTVTTTSPFAPTLPVVEVTANGEALYVFILPVVGFPEGSVITCSSPETNQFWLMT